MDAYKVKSIVKNGQLIIDLPEEFDDKEVEITVFQVAKTVYGETSEDISVAEEVTQSSYLSSKKIEQTDKTEQSNLIKSEQAGIIPPRIDIDLSTLMGAYRHKMTNDEIDLITKNIRNEWDRDFS